MVEEVVDDGGDGGVEECGSEQKRRRTVVQMWGLVRWWRRSRPMTGGRWRRFARLNFFF